MSFERSNLNSKMPHDTPQQQNVGGSTAYVMQQVGSNMPVSVCNETSEDEMLAALRELCIKNPALLTRAVQIMYYGLEHENKPQSQPQTMPDDADLVRYKPSPRP